MADFENIVKTHATEDGNIPATAIPALVTAIKTAVGNEFVDKERYKAKLTEIDTLKEQQQTAEDNATTAGKWKDKYSDLDKEYKAYKAQIAGEKTLESKKAAFRIIAKDAGLTDAGIEKATKYKNWDEIELDESGNIKNPKDQIKIIREEWPEHISAKIETAIQTATPPAGMASDNGNGNRAAQLYQQHHAALYGQTEKGESK